MGQKTNPISNRIGITRGWDSNWVGGNYAEKIAEDYEIRKYLGSRLAKASLSRIIIERTLKLRQPMYVETAAYGHMGRKCEVVQKTFTSHYHETKTMNVELFTWEKLDRVDDIRKEFGL